MENWRKRWERFMFTEDMIVGGGTVLNPKPETYSDFVRMLDDIENFISQELDRAREEGYKKGREDQQHLDGLFYGTTVATTTTLEEGWILKHKKKVEEELSKLTTNLN
jgi:hypothetical protein